MVSIDKMNSLIKPFINSRQIPGMAIAIIDNKEFQYYGYGYSDVKNKVPINDFTLFEIGSMSKAFTALGVLWLEYEEMLSMDNNIKQYIPWFNPYYLKNRKHMIADITISDLLYHTSGIPFNTLFSIPHNSDNNIWNLRNIRLIQAPGSIYHYSSNNYNILAYIIEVITKEPFETFIKKTILHPLGLFHTHLSRSDAKINSTMSKGYKLSFFRQREFNAPFIKGNLAGGYIISCIHDMKRWIQIQIGMEEVDEKYKILIDKSHEVKGEIIENPGYKNAAGWHINKETDVVQYMGSNPNFSSKIIFSKSKQWGICVLANTNISATFYLADNILKCNKPKLIKPYHVDIFKKTDLIFSVLSIMNNIFLIFIFLNMLFNFSEDLFNYNRYFLYGLIIWTSITVILPYIVKKTLKWRAILLWMSLTIPFACISGIFSMLIGWLLCVII